MTPYEPPTSSAVVVVDEADRQIGVCDKVAAHRPPGRRHRAFSVFLFTPAGRLLLQRRAATKYHFAGRWSNSCDGHPGPHDALVDAAERRVFEELGVRVNLTPIGTFMYEAADDVSGLVENEIDHVLVGEIAVAPGFNPEEVAEVRYWRVSDLSDRLAASPEEFVPWLSPGLATVQAAGAGRWAC